MMIFTKTKMIENDNSKFESVLKDLEEKPEMEQKLKAIIQQYMIRMKKDSLTIKANSAN